MAYCTNCGKENTGKKICEHCGVKKTKTHKFCEWCGTAFDSKAKVCSNCGEHKKTVSAIGKVFRIFFAVCFLIAGLYSIGKSLIPSLFFLFFSALLLPITKRVFLKVTHSNLKARKVIRYCAIPITTILLVLSMNSCMTADSYTRAVEYWDKQAYAAAMNLFAEDPDYKDSSEYIERFETEVVASLMQTPWCCDIAYYTASDNTGTRLDYQFNEDGTVLRRTQLWSGSYGDTHSLKSYDDFTLPYSLYYDVNDETGVYEARIRIGPDHNYHDYVLSLGVEDEKIVVLGFVGDIEVEDQSLAGRKNILVAQYFSRDTSLPE